MINKARIIQTMVDLVKIDSPSGEEDAVAQELKLRFEDLEGKVVIDETGNVIATFDGVGEPIIFSAHMDTVEPGRGVQPQVQDDRITSNGQTILGADPKAGLAVIIESLTSVHEDKIEHRPVEVVLTREEEVGSKGAQSLNFSALQSKQAIVFDGDEEVGHVNNAAPGYWAVDMEIIGKAAHAGVEPEKGISSIKIAAELIHRLTLGRIDEETTANVGLISGGSARNAVPERTELKGEFRSRDAEKLTEQVEQFKKVVQEVGASFPEARLNYHLEKHFDSYSIPLDAPFIQKITEALQAIGVTPRVIPTGGGTDANFYNAHGIQAVVVGTGVREMHTTQENLTISEMMQAAQFAQKMLVI